MHKVDPHALGLRCAILRHRAETGTEASAGCDHYRAASGDGQRRITASILKIRLFALLPFRLHATERVTRQLFANRLTIFGADAMLANLIAQRAV